LPRRPKTIKCTQAIGFLGRRLRRASIKAISKMVAIDSRNTTT
jgi:hypothetical protein